MKLFAIVPFAIRNPGTAPNNLERCINQSWREPAGVGATPQEALAVVDAYLEATNEFVRWVSTPKGEYKAEELVSGAAAEALTEFDLIITFDTRIEGVTRGVKILGYESGIMRFAAPIVL